MLLQANLTLIMNMMRIRNFEAIENKLVITVWTISKVTENFEDMKQT